MDWSEKERELRRKNDEIDSKHKLFLYIDTGNDNRKVIIF